MDSTHIGRRYVLAGVCAAAFSRLGPDRATAGVWHDGIIPAVLDDEEILGTASAEEAACHVPFRGEFARWLGVARERFARRVELVADCPTGTLLHVPGLHPALAISLESDGGINVFVTWQGTCWDILASFDVWPESSDGAGWRSLLLLVPDAQELRASREACWVSDGFEPLLRWFNEDLTPATHLALLGRKDKGWTAAQLVQDGRFQRSGEQVQGCEYLQHLLPLHAAA